MSPTNVEGDGLEEGEAISADEDVGGITK